MGIMAATTMVTTMADTTISLITIHIIVRFFSHGY
jgi:hypothetical protein